MEAIMRHRAQNRWNSLILAVLATATAASMAAQSIGADPPNLAAGGGASSTGSFAADNIESVNVVNGNMSLTIPLAHLPPGPSGFAAGINLVYNSAINDLKTKIDSPTVLAMPYSPSAHGGGWNYSYKYTIWTQTRIAVFDGQTCSGVSATEAANWYKTVLTTPDGANHILRLTGGTTSQGADADISALSTEASRSYAIYDFGGIKNANCGVPTGSFGGVLRFATSDGTYIRVEADTVAKVWAAYFPDGTKVSGPINFVTGQPAPLHATDSDATQITDRNGNVINIVGNCNVGVACTETLTDSKGRTMQISYSSKGSGAWTDTIASNGPNGALTTTVNWQNYTPPTRQYPCRTTATGAPTGAQCTLDSTNATASVVASIKIPPGQTNGDSVNFKFDYAATVPATSWGELHATTMCAGTDLTVDCPQIWKSSYTYLFDTSSSPTRSAGTAINPIASRTLNYTEKLTSGTAGSENSPRTETTAYTVPIPAHIYQYPVTTNASVNPSGIAQAQVTYPDGSYALTFTANLCPPGSTLRDLCVAVPYKTLGRDGSVTEMGWVSNTAPPGVPSGAIFNPYVRYTVTKPTNDAIIYKITSVQLDQNGNATSKTEYDWASSSAFTRDANGFIATACTSGCTVKRTTSSTYFGNGQAFWQAGAPRYLRAPDTVTTGTASTSFVYDNALTTANVTQVKRWDSLTSSYLISTATYLSNGNVESKTDPRGVKTLICYDTNQLYPVTKVTGVASGGNCASGNPAKLPEGRKTTYNFHFGSGTLTSRTDADNSITASYTYDNLGRTTNVTQTAGAITRSTATVYDDKALTIKTTQQDTTPLVSWTYLDPLGRVRLTIDPAGNRIQKAYRFGTGGGVSYELTSNPYTNINDSTIGWTLTTQQLSTPGSAVLTVTNESFSGNTLPTVWGGSNSTVTGTSNTVITGANADCAISLAVVVSRRPNLVQLKPYRSALS